MTTNEVAKGNGGGVVRQEFGATQLEVVRETAAIAVAEREKAVVQARYIMALQRPRDIERCRQELLKACAYVDFAKAAWFDLTKHSKGEGFTIRFAEEALRAFGNVYPEMAVVYESEDTRIVRVTVTDMEANVPYSSEIVIKKRIEKKSPRPGDIVISKRTNSKGETVSLVESTDEEILKQTNGLKSRAIRTDGLRLIPAWLKEECKRAIFATQDGDIKKDPAEAKRKIIDAFSEIGVAVAELVAYLGHSTDTISPKEIIELRGVYAAIKDGQASWAELLQAKQPDKPGSAAAAAEVAERKLDELRKETEAAKEASSNAAGLTEEEKSQTDPQKGFTFGGKK